MEKSLSKTRVAETFVRRLVTIYKMGHVKLFMTVIYYKIFYDFKQFFTFGVEKVKVKVTEGVLLGRKLVSVLGKPYYRFQGIPYAKPPIGPLRFKDPEPPEPWEGVRSALKEGNLCIQRDVITGFTRGSENCLFLNIFTPELPQDSPDMKKKAVLFWIHGGAFQLGSGNAEIYSSDFFLEDDVVLVTINYRMGVLGFLSTGTEDAPGNAGLKDMVQALKWVKNNIEVFGGDPNNVTIFGESAGGAAVQYLMLSPLAKGLFHRAISQSGSALCPWAFNENPVESAFKMGRAFGIDTSDPKILVDYLRKVSPAALAKKQSAAISDLHKRETIPFIFLPCLEPASYKNAFLTEKPRKLLEEGTVASDVPYITGINEMEGAIILKSIIDKHPPAKDIEKDFERVVPRYLNLEYGSEKSKKVSEKIREFYFENKAFDKKTYKEYAKLTTDTWFVLHTQKTTCYHWKMNRAPVYNYEFTFDGDMGLFKKILKMRSLPGPAHADELGYLFYIPILGPPMDSKTQEMKVTKKMVRLWTNFAKYGNPTPHPDDPYLGNLVWSPSCEADPCYLIISDELKMGKNMKQREFSFWKDIETKISEDTIR